MILSRSVVVLAVSLLLVGCDEPQTPQPPVPAEPEQTEADVQADAAQELALEPVPERAEDVQPVSVGESAPTAVLVDADENAADLGVFLGRGPTVLIFYRGGWCPFCTAHLSELAQNHEQLQAMGAQILAVSPDRPAKIAQSLAALAELDISIDYQLLSDRDMALSRKFGVAFRVEDSTVERYRTMGLDLADAAGQDHRMLPVPAVFVIDEQGIIRFTYVDADYRQRIDGQELLTVVRQITEQ